MTMLTYVPVSKEYIFAHVPKAKLFALLIGLSLNARVFQKLCIKGRRFNDDFRNRQNLKHGVNT